MTTHNTVVANRVAKRSGLPTTELFLWRGHLGIGRCQEKLVQAAIFIYCPVKGAAHSQDK